MCMDFGIQNAVEHKQIFKEQNHFQVFYSRVIIQSCTANVFFCMYFFAIVAYHVCHFYSTSSACDLEVEPTVHTNLYVKWHLDLPAQTTIHR